MRMWREATLAATIVTLLAIGTRPIGARPQGSSGKSGLPIADLIPADGSKPQPEKGGGEPVKLHDLTSGSLGTLGSRRTGNPVDDTEVKVDSPAGDVQLKIPGGGVPPSGGGGKAIDGAPRDDVQFTFPGSSAPGNFPGGADSGVSLPSLPGAEGRDPSYDYKPPGSAATGASPSKLGGAGDFDQFGGGSLGQFGAGGASENFGGSGSTSFGSGGSDFGQFGGSSSGDSFSSSSSSQFGGGGGGAGSSQFGGGSGLDQFGGSSSSSFGAGGSGQFGSSGSDPFGGSSSSQLGASGSGLDQFGSSSSSSFGASGSSQLGAGGSDPFGASGSSQFGAGGASGSSQLGAGGSDPFGAGGSTQFGAGGSDPFGASGSAGQFGGSGSGQFGAGGPDQFGAGGSSQFGGSGSGQFGASGSDQFGAGGSSQFGGSGSDQFGAGGSIQFGGSGSDQFGAGGSIQFGGSGSGQFGAGGSDQFGAGSGLGLDQVGSGSPSQFGGSGSGQFGAGGSDLFGGSPSTQLGGDKPSKTPDLPLPSSPGLDAKLPDTPDRNLGDGNQKVFNNRHSHVDLLSHFLPGHKNRQQHSGHGGGGGAASNPIGDILALGANPIKKIFNVLTLGAFDNNQQQQQSNPLRDLLSRLTLGLLGGGQQGGVAGLDLSAIGLGEEAIGELVQVASSGLDDLARETSAGIRLAQDEVRFQAGEKVRQFINSLQQTGRTAGIIGQNTYRSLLQKKDALAKLLVGVVTNLGRYVNTSVGDTFEKVGDTANIVGKFINDLKVGLLNSLISKGENVRELVSGTLGSVGTAVKDFTSAAQSAAEDNIKAITGLTDKKLS